MKKLFAILIALNLFLFAQSQTIKAIYPSATIEPFEYVAAPVNFPLGQATPVGDINGDGNEDLVFQGYVADERTSDPKDKLPKSVITLEAGVNSDQIVLYNSIVYGIGDYNGDGFDDILDHKQKKIRFGCADGISEDSLVIYFADNYEEFLYSGDINNDGMSEFLIWDGYNNDTLLIFSGSDVAPIIYKTDNWYSSFDKDHAFFYCYDYDNDGDDELCVTSDRSYYNDRYIRWYYLDKANNQFILEHQEFYDYVNEPSIHYPAAFCDINGDKIMDFAHVYYEYDSAKRHHLEVCFGLATEPYFDLPVEIEVGNPNRLFYSAGDFNGDGADDWYSKLNEDTMIVYYGGPNVLTEGFQEGYYTTGDNQLLLPKGGSYSSFHNIYKMQELFYNNDSIADLFFNYWTFDDNLQFDVIGTAIVLGGETPDFANPLVVGNSGNQSFKELEYGYSSKNIGDINQDGFDDWGVLAEKACYLDVFFGGSVLDLEPDIKYLLPQTNKAECFDWATGDLNGDGWIDIAISNSSNYEVGLARSFITPQNDIYIYFGSPSNQSEFNYEDADVVLHDDSTFREFGKHLAVVGDYNADGFNDLVVGGAAQWGDLKNAFMYYGGNQINSVPDLVIGVSSSTGGPFGDPITPCGDINADGYDDFTLGVPNSSFGKSLVYYGGPFADDMYDMMIYSPGNVVHFGRGPRTQGDFDGDGNSDLVYFSHIDHEIYIFKGGPDFDQYYDYLIYDSAFNYFTCIEYIDNVETGVSDIIVSYSNNGNYDYYIYPGGSIQNQQPKYVLKNDLDQSGVTVASGDFNNDGYTDIFAGIAFENNFGNPDGGVVNFYEPTLFVSVDENEINDISNTLSLFPNPVLSTLNVGFDVEIPGSVTIKLINIMGNTCLLETRYFVHTGKAKLQIKMDKYEGGVYFLELQQGESVSRSKLVHY